MAGPVQNLILNVKANVSNALLGFRNVKKEAGELSRTLRQDLAGQLKAVFGVSALYAFGQAALQSARQLEQFARSQGLTLEQAAELQRIAEKYGVTADQVIGKNEEVAKRQEEAIKRATTAWKNGEDRLSALEKIGLNLAKSISITADESERMIQTWQEFEPKSKFWKFFFEPLQHPFLAYQAVTTGTTVDQLKKVQSQAESFQASQSTKESIISENRKRALDKRLEDPSDKKAKELVDKLTTAIRPQSGGGLKFIGGFAQGASPRITSIEERQLSELMKQNEKLRQILRVSEQGVLV